MRAFAYIMAVCLAALGYNYIYQLSTAYYVMFLVFIGVSLSILLHLIRMDIKRNIIYIFAMTSWMFYNSLGFIHSAIIETQRGQTLKFGIEIYLLLIIATIIISISMLSTKGAFTTGFSFLKNYRLPRGTLFFIFTVSLLLDLYKIHIAGGLNAYIFAPYGAKAESGLLTFFNLTQSIFNNIALLALPYIVGDCNKSTKAICIFFLTYKMAFGAISGSSVSLLSPLICTYIFAYYAGISNRVKLKLKKYTIVLAIVAVTAGMFIRTNRKSFENSSIESFEIKNAFDEIMESPTFDNIVNLNTIFDKIQPVYIPEQLILPFIHFLPRSVFTWKPMELGRMVGYKFIGTSEDSMAGFITTPIGEFYYDFGFTGVIIGLILVGLSLGYIQEKLNATKGHPIFIWSIVVVTATKTSSLSAWYTGCYKSLVDLAVIIVLILVLNTFFKPIKTE